MAALLADGQYPSVLEAGQVVCLACLKCLVLRCGQAELAALVYANDVEPSLVLY